MFGVLEDVQSNGDQVVVTIRLDEMMHYSADDVLRLVGSHMSVIPVVNHRADADEMGEDGE